MLYAYNACINVAFFDVITNNILNLIALYACSERYKYITLLSFKKAAIFVTLIFAHDSRSYRYHYCDLCVTLPLHLTSSRKPGLF